MVKIGIVGASGYTARELLKILSRHPAAEVVRITSRQLDGQPVLESHPSQANFSGLKFCQFDAEDFARCGVKCAFTCLPHAASAAAVTQLAEHGIKVIDFSADYRLNDVSTFETWYNVSHPDPNRVGNVPYGLPELFREQIKNQNIVANPGCFPTSAILPLAPLFQDSLLDCHNIIIDSKSGITGAGRNPKPHLHFPEANESVTAYAIGQHRHGPEIEQILERSTGVESKITFTPHLIPMDRGILSTIYFKTAAGAGIGEIKESLTKKYSDELFVRIRESAPQTKDVVGTNFCDIHVASNKDQIILISVIDNLVKGASGAAVQNFNVLFDFDESTALI